MKINDIIIESPNAIGRAAQALGMSAKQAMGNISQKAANKVKKASLGVASNVSNAATGKLAVAKEAESLIKDFKFYLGSSNQTPTVDSLMKFIKQEGHPEDVVQSVLNNFPSNNSNQVLPANIINKIMNSVAEHLISTGNVQVSKKSTGNTATGNSNNSGSLDINQIKTKINRFDKDERQEIINHLKQIDTFNVLKY